MKQLTIIFLLLSTTAFSQDNRFTEVFAKADSAFNQQLLSNNNQEQKTLDKMISIIESMDHDTLKVRASQLILMYWTGYIDGGTYSLEKGEFNFRKLNEAILANKESLNRWIRFKQQQLMTNDQ